MEPSLTLRPVVQDDFEFAFRVKREAIGPHIAARWGWNEEFQREFHGRRWRERPWFIIVKAGVPIGTVSVMRNDASVRFGEFYLLPAFQRHGIGSTVLASVLACADAEDLPVELEYLKWNPVGSLYQRFGFVIVGENEIHYFLVRERAGETPSLMRTSGGSTRIDCATLFPSALFTR